MSWREEFGAWEGSSSSADSAARNQDQELSDTSTGEDSSESTEQIAEAPSWRNDADQWLDYESSGSDAEFLEDLTDEDEQYFDQEQHYQYDDSDEYDWDDELDWDEDEAPRRRLSFPSLPTISPRYVVAAVVGAVVLGCGAAWFLSGEQEQEQAQDVRFSVVDNSAESTSASLSSTPVSTPCEGMPAASDDSLAGVVVAFNTAYYSNDAQGLLETVAEDSYLAEQAWDELLPDFAGSSWCAKTSALTESTASVDTTVTLPSGTKTSHQQTYEFEWADGAARIESISSRES
ncbi:hypothetical protein [Corynebacterium sputi]|uniref:hypothetical protein n=1 Tax=Corynebacterium sputi TaxID=489915 RepID=UPI0004086472|nr:hypothetical protein [Corynebacterium sputi]